MNCNCQKLQDYGFKPNEIKHRVGCIYFSNYLLPDSPFKEEWKSESDRIKFYGQNKRNLQEGSKKAQQTIRNKRARKTGRSSASI